jgi:hypothetical protein
VPNYVKGKDNDGRRIEESSVKEKGNLLKEDTARWIHWTCVSGRIRASTAM